MTLFGSGRPPASRTSTVSWDVIPSCTSTCAGAITTVLGPGGLTVTVVDPVFPSHVAVMTAVPTLCAVTEPVDVTVATDALLVDQSTTRPTNGLPSASSGCAWSWAV